jgi:hypothetical protein
VSKEDRYGAYSAGFEAGKEAGRLATLKELGIDPDYKPEMSRYIVTDEGFTQVDTNTATQNRRILAYLKSGGALTPKDALNLFGSFRLSARIFELREEGWPIDMRYLQVGPRTWVALFSMQKDAVRGKPRNPAKQMELAI